MKYGNSFNHAGDSQYAYPPAGYSSIHELQKRFCFNLLVFETASILRLSQSCLWPARALPRLPQGPSPLLAFDFMMLKICVDESLLTLTDALWRIGDYVDEPSEPHYSCLDVSARIAFLKSSNFIHSTKRSRLYTHVWHIAYVDSCVRLLDCIDLFNTLPHCSPLPF